MPRRRGDGEARTAVPWELELAGVGAFPHLGRPATLWIGVAPPGSAALAELAGRLDDALHLAAASLARNAPSRCTLPSDASDGRTPAGLPALDRGLLQENAGLAFGPARIDRLTVYASDLQRGGPVYTPLGEYPFGG